MDGGVWAVGVPTAGPGAAYSGSKCAGTGLTAGNPNEANALLICAPFTVPAASDNPRLRFWHWFSTESGYDYGQVQIKVGSGAWQTLSSNYTGYSGPWTRTSFDLSGFAGQSVQVGFFFHSDSSINGDGWYLDEVTLVMGIMVQQPVGTHLTTGSSTVDFGSAMTGVAVPLTFTLKNTGTAPLTDIAVTADGTNSADYALITAPATSLAAGDSTTFVVTFTPSATGTREAVLHIVSNDPTDNPFNINLIGIGTAAPPPTVATGTASGITAASATLNGTVNPNGFTTTARFEYGLTDFYGSTADVTLSPDNGTSEQAVSASISGLQAGTTYHYQLTATNSGGTSPGEDMTFATAAAGSPMVTSQPVSRTNVIGSTATFSVAAMGDESLNYQWRFNGTNLNNGVNISGVTTTDLTLTNVQASDVGNYTVVVTSTTAASPVTWRVYPYILWRLRHWPNAALATAGATAVANSEFAGNGYFPAGNAIDGNLGNYWAAVQYVYPWELTVTFAAKYPIVRVNLVEDDWDPAFSTSGIIEYNDGGVWKTISNFTKNSPGLDITLPSPIECQQVRFTGTSASAPGNWYNQSDRVSRNFRRMPW